MAKTHIKMLLHH